MSQRNPLNERYTSENRTGKTRKSSASAKPKATRAATLRDPAPKTKKQKKQEARERERKEQQKASVMESNFESTEGYKRLRRIWWGVLIGAIVCTALSFALQGNENMRQLSMVSMIMAYALIIAAFYIDLGKIRKERKLYNAALLANKSKDARKEQKRLRAEQREQEKEAAEKYEAAKAEEEAKAAKRRDRFKRFGFGKKKNAAEGEAESEDGQGESSDASKA